MSFLKFFTILTFFALVYAVQGTKVRKCSGKNDVKLVNGSVSISACEAAPCKLRRKDDVIVNIKFIPETDIQKFRTNVHMKLLGIPFPFIGVDGISACETVYEKDGKTKATCPLSKGKEYVYESSFKVQEIYPTVKGVVHWALHDSGANKDVTCFEILAKIV